MRERYLSESELITFFLVCPDQDDATTQLITHRIQMMASNAVGHVVVQPLRTKPTHSPR
jgi:hypothetical protein